MKNRKSDKQANQPAKNPKTATAKAKVAAIQDKKPDAKTSPKKTPTPVETTQGALKSASAKKGEKSGKVSALDAAAKVLGESSQPMTCKEMIATMAAKNLWLSPGGRTPEATLYSAILRELKTKGAASRFKKTDRGKFAHA